MAIIQTTPVNSCDLIDVDRAATNAQLAALNTASSRKLLSNLIAAASRKIKNYCKRDLVLTDYVTVRDGGTVPSPELHLQYPVVSISRLATDPEAVMTVANNSSANQRSTVSTTTSGVTLFWEDSGASLTDTSSVFATYPTLATLAAQINSIGNGWTATVSPGYEQYPSQDLMPTQGALPASSLLASQGAQLIMYTETTTSIGSYYFADGYTSLSTDGAWRLNAQEGLLYAANLPRGPQSMRIDYRAGFSAIPDDVQEATVLTAVAIYRAGLINPALASERLGDASWTLATKQTAIPALARDLLSEHIDYAGLHCN